MSALRAPLSLVVAAVILLACAGTGMVTGVFAHAIAGNLTGGATPTSAPVISGTPPLAAATETSTPESTATATTSVNTTSGFVLTIAISKRTLSAGETFTVTVLATIKGAPVEGLVCSIRAPIGGPKGLFTSWPAAQSTDANGHVVWTLTAPSVASGTYGIEVEATGTHHYEFHRYTTLTMA